jgi:hypothetical protein
MGLFFCKVSHSRCDICSKMFQTEVVVVVVVAVVVVIVVAIVITVVA